jgi:16S rRNA (uracil1498-N3)-methyltransferase
VPKPLRVPFAGLAPGVCPLGAALGRYVTRVHRLGPGARLCLFDPEVGLEADGELVAGPSPEVWCRVGEPRPSGYRALPVHLLQGLGKADKPDEVIRAATALGVASVRLVQTERSVARLTAERGSGRLERWRRIAIEAARQSGRGDIPALDAPSALADALARVDASARITLAASADPLYVRLGAWRGLEPLALLVGPEGGLDAAEQRLAEGAGFLPASLGSTTLRSELAGVAALGALVALAAAPIHP